MSDTKGVIDVQIKNKDNVSHPQIADKLAHEQIHHLDEKELQSRMNKAEERRKSLEKAIVDKAHADVEKAKKLSAQKHQQS